MLWSLWLQKRFDTKFFFHPSLLLLFVARDSGSGLGKNQAPGSGINIPDPQHWNICIKIFVIKFFPIFPGWCRLWPCRASSPVQPTTRATWTVSSKDIQPIRASRRGSRGLFLPNRAYETALSWRESYRKGLACEKIFFLCVFCFFFWLQLQYAEKFFCLLPITVIRPSFIQSFLGIQYFIIKMCFVEGFPLLLIILFSMFVMCYAGSFFVTLPYCYENKVFPWRFLLQILLLSNF